MLNFVAREFLNEILAKCVDNGGFIRKITFAEIIGFVKSRNFEITKCETMVIRNIMKFYEAKNRN